jgi:nucleotide-binding universal stress UspA family protein
MEKLTRILAVVDHARNAPVLLDKAVSLARRFNALVEVIVSDGPAASLVAARSADMAYDEVSLFCAFRGAEPLHELVMRRVSMTRPDLVIKDPAGRHPTRRWTLDENDWHLAAECPVPLILAGPRAWSQPMRFAAAVDVADREAEAVARGILQTAGLLALGCRANLDVLYSEREEQDETIRMARAVKVAALVREFHVGCERLQIWDGEPEKRLPGLLSARHYDLLLLGAVTHRDGLMASMNLVTSALVDAADADVVLVKPGERAVMRGRVEQPSASQQRLH